MEIDYKAIVAFAALGLSLYNFFCGRRTKAIEKRTEVLAELSYAQVLASDLSISLIHFEAGGLSDIPNFHTRALNLRTKNDDIHKMLSEIFNSLESARPQSIDSLELLRPRIQDTTAKLEQVKREVDALINEARGTASENSNITPE